MRIWQIDAVRGIAVILMVIFHFVFDLSFFLGAPVAGLDDGFWFYVGRLSAILFIGVSGMMSTFSFARNKGVVFFKKSCGRAGRIFAAALLVSAVTYFFDKNFTVLFGILHFLAASALLAIFFVRFKAWNLLLAVLLFAINFQLRDNIAGTYFLLPFGFPPSSFQSFDYYPLLPWFSVFLSGMGLGNFIFKKSGQAITLSGKALKGFGLKGLSGLEAGKSFRGFWQFCGRHSLAIYLIHQPVLLGLLYFWQIYFSNP